MTTPLSPATRRAHYAALKRHDRRFDGRFFIGVTSTGIYCRPVCPAKIPRFDNCTFHQHPAAAERAGFRPCLVCRPELAPGDAKVDADSTLARLALRRIEDGAINDLGVVELAAEFNVCGSELQRALTQEFGVNVDEIAETQRLLSAKQLLTETDMPLADVAFAAGFKSLYRFNTLFRTRYRLRPSALRGKRVAKVLSVGGYACPGALSLRIDYRPPLNWDTLIAFLGARAIPGVETVEHNTYLRTVEIGGYQGWIGVRPYTATKRARPLHALNLIIAGSLKPVSAQLLAKIKTLFDTRANPLEIDQHLSADPLLAKIIGCEAGMRLPGAFDGFELVLRAILGQQVSVKGATTLAGRAAREFGSPIATPWPGLTHLSPDADRIANANVGRIAKIGMPAKRAATIQTVAKLIVSGQLALAPGCDPEIVRERLLAVSGIGEWTASYVGMRALAWPDSLPLGDLGVKKALGLTRAADIERRTAKWRPWRAYAAIYLWLSLSGG